MSSAVVLLLPRVVAMAARSGGPRQRRVLIKRVRRPLGALTLILLQLILGCAPKHGLPQREDDRIVIRIANNHPLDVTVYAVNQGMRVRLGTVSTATSERFELALREINPSGELRLLADPVGSRRPTLSEPIQVFPGQVVEWVLAADLRQSALTIRS